MVDGFSKRAAALVLALGLTITTAGTGEAGLFINEFFFNPNGNELPREYVELRGDTPNMSLADYWLIVVEGEGSLEAVDNEVGMVDNAIDLGAMSLGSNGFLALRRAGNPFSLASGAASADLPNADFEGGGGTFMLIKKGTGPIPEVGMRLDGSVDNDANAETVYDGLDFPTGRDGWNIVDSIGVIGESEEMGFARTYAPTTFGYEPDGYVFPPDMGGVFHAADHIEPGGVYVPVGFEVELFARYGNSTGQGEHDWHITNVTDNGLAGGSASQGRWVQSGSDPHGYPREPFAEGQYQALPNCDYACYLANYHKAETSQYIPYGTPMTTTLGGPNYPLNETGYLPWDYNKNGTVDAADYTIWRNTLGQTDPSPGTNPLAANANRNATVDYEDYLAWKYHFGESLPLPIGAGGLAVPEPATLLLFGIGSTMIASMRKRR